MGNPRFIFFAVLTALFPLVLALGIVLIPVVRNYADHELAEAAAAKSKRWFWGHFLSAIGFGLGIVVSAAINLYLLWSINRFWAGLSTAVPSGYGLYVTAVVALIIYLPLAGLFWQLATFP